VGGRSRISIKKVSLVTSFLFEKRIERIHRPASIIRGGVEEKGEDVQCASTLVRFLSLKRGFVPP